MSSGWKRFVEGRLLDAEDDGLLEDLSEVVEVVAGLTKLLCVGVTVKMEVGAATLVDDAAEEAPAAMEARAEAETVKAPDVTEGSRLCRMSTGTACESGVADEEAPEVATRAAAAEGTVSLLMVEDDESSALTIAAAAATAAAAAAASCCCWWATAAWMRARTVGSLVSITWSREGIEGVAVA